VLLLLSVALFQEGPGLVGFPPRNFLRRPPGRALFLPLGLLFLTLPPLVGLFLVELVPGLALCHHAFFLLQGVVAVPTAIRGSRA
jgi:hypothetical protein